MSKRDLLNFHGLSRREFDGILTLASELKRKQKRGVAHRLLAGKGLALVFEKPSLTHPRDIRGGNDSVGRRSRLSWAR